MREFIAKLMVGLRNRFVQLGLLGSILLVLWWIVKIIICAFTGICIIF